MNEIRERLRKLTALVGISSREDDVVKYMAGAFLQCTDNVEVDMLGNVTAAFLSGHVDAQKIIFFAHMDEVGMMVKKVEDNGFLRLERLSAVNSHVLLGAVYNVRTHNGKLIKGVIGAKAHHVMSAEEKSRLPEISQLFLDIGCRSAREAEELGVTAGCVVAFEHQFVEMPGNIVATKSLDDRVGLVVLLGLADHLKGKSLPFDVYLTASVQEEFSIRGIMPAVRKIDPDIAIGIDITPAADTPDLAGFNESKLGGGPALTYYNYHGRGTLNGIIPNEKLVQFFEATCNKESITFQREVCRGVLNETAYIAISGEKGVATASVCIPTRYAHTPVEAACLDDIAATTKLLCAFTDTWNPEINLRKHM
ncbi:MAG: M42 family peptidase [Oscillospiraceae bacterium]|nr:M42 family peptidase [Oscillospiraceae bacterium]